MVGAVHHLPKGAIDLGLEWTAAVLGGDSETDKEGACCGEMHRVAHGRQGRPAPGRRDMIAIMSFPAFIDILLRAASGDLSLARGQMLFGAGDKVRNLFVVREGCIRLVRYQENGGGITLQRAQQGELLAEASLFAARYHCAAVADADSRVAVISKARIAEIQAEHADWLSDLAAHLAHQVQLARARAELLSQKTVAQKLDGWRALHGDEFPPRGHWIEVAQEIGVSPEALYRELARRRLDKPAAGS